MALIAQSGENLFPKLSGPEFTSWWGTVHDPLTNYVECTPVYFVFVQVYT